MTSGISLDRPAAGAARTYAPVIDQHATWIGVNPIQGCPKGCAYCFLRDRGQAPARPE
jgi:DNA repair photolyase